MSKFISFILIFLFIHFNINSAIQILFSDDFEDENIGDSPDLFVPAGTFNPDWDNAVMNVNGGGIITAGSNVIVGGNIGGNITNKYYLSIDNGGQNVFLGAAFDQSTERYVVVEYDVYLTNPYPTVHPAGEIIYADNIEDLDGTAVSTRIAIHLEFSDEVNIADDGAGANDGIYYITGEDNVLEDYTEAPPAAETYFGSFLENRWYKVQVIADQANKMFDLKITDLVTGTTQQALNLPYNDPLAGYIRKIWFGVSASNPNVYFDNIMIYQDTTPPPNPDIIDTRARPGNENIYMRFNTSVRDIGGGILGLTNFSYNDNPPPAGPIENNLVNIDTDRMIYLYEMDAVLSADDIIKDTFDTAGIVNDRYVGMGVTSFPVSSIGIDFFTNVYLEDYDHRGKKFQATRLDGSEHIEIENMRVTAAFNIPEYAAEIPVLYCDTFVLESSARFWNPDTNSGDIQITGTSIGGNNWEFIIPIKNIDIRRGGIVSFIFKLGTFYCYRGVYPVNHSRFYEAETYMVHSIKIQNNSTTILNNVINPHQGERAKLIYTLDKSGPVSIVVYDLKSDIVKILKKKTQSEGTHYVTWDGRNENGRIVSRGVYFIRIRAPGIFNQIRKVLITK